MSEAPLSAFPWYALRVKNRHEKAVAASLESKGLVSFLPLYRARRRVFTRKRDVQMPLFPGYVFCRINVTNRLPVLMIPGVFDIVHAGKIFFPVEESEIDALQTIVKSALYAQPWPFLKVGHRVRLADGP